MPLMKPSLPSTTHTWLAPFWLWLRRTLGYFPVRLYASAWPAAATYVAGTKTFTADANGAMGTVDSVAPAVGDRIAYFAGGSSDGIFRVVSLGGVSSKFSLIRDEDLNASGDFVDGASFRVTAGTTNKGKQFMLSVASSFVMDTNTPTATASASTVSAATVVTALAAASAITFLKEVAATISIAATTTSNTVGAALSIIAGAGQGSGAGGAISVKGAAGGATGAGGAATFKGGDGGATSGAGGATVFSGGDAQAGNSSGGGAKLRGGAKTGSGVAGAVDVGDSATSFVNLGASGIPVQLKGDGTGTGAVVERFGRTDTEGLEIRVYDVTVTPAAVETNLLNTPANSVILSVQANCEVLLVGGGTTVTWSIGTSATPNKYGTAGNGAGDTLLKNGKLDFTPTHTRLATAEQMVLTGCATGGAADGDTALTVGSVRVRVVYLCCNSLDDAA